uniref:Uncharacterized protein n=1 Tax=Rhodosorus marinus TaxID=101924 RepID=A0A7S3A1Z9_9RHOD
MWRFSTGHSKFYYYQRRLSAEEASAKLERPDRTTPFVKFWFLLMFDPVSVSSKGRIVAFAWRPCGETQILGVTTAEKDLDQRLHTCLLAILEHNPLDSRSCSLIPWWRMRLFPLRLK